MTRRDLTAAILAGLAVAGMAYALTRIRWGAMPDVPWTFLAGIAVGSLSTFRLGRYYQAWDHSRRGVLAGHLKLIRGHR